MMPILVRERLETDLKVRYQSLRPKESYAIGNGWTMKPSPIRSKKRMALLWTLRSLLSRQTRLSVPGQPKPGGTACWTLNSLNTATVQRAMLVDHRANARRRQEAEKRSHILVRNPTNAGQKSH